jgi:hypothetical protein
MKKECYSEKEGLGMYKEKKRTEIGRKGDSRMLVSYPYR